MATKTISLQLEAYEKLKAAKRYPGESFSQVVLRARWPEDTVTSGAFLELCREHGAHFTTEELQRISDLKKEDRPPEDKWKKR